MNKTPPELAVLLLTFFLKEELHEEVIGDLEEAFHSYQDKHSLTKAKIHYWFQVLNYLRPFAIKNFKAPQINPAMFRHNLKVSYRTLLKNKTFSLINIGGLAIGLTVSILIGLWVFDEYSYDKNHENYDRIVQVMRKDISPKGIQVNSSLTGGVGVELESNFPHLFAHTAMTFFRSNEQILTIEENSYEEMGYFFQPSITHILSLKMLEGTRDALNNPSNTIISRSLANKLFRNGKAMNKTINLNANVDLIVSGIFEDLPENSTFGDADFLASQALIYNENNPYGWDNYNMKLYAQLEPNVSIENASLAIKDIIKPYRDADSAPRELFLLPMKDWHLNSTFEQGVQVVSERVQYIRLYIVIGIFILLIACINFMNLNTAQYQTRGKEVGIRKTIGSVRSEVASQFLVESFLYVFGALVLSLILAQILLPSFNAISDKEMVIEWLNPYFWIACLAFSFIVSLFAGSYPAVFLSSFKPIEALKGKVKQGTTSAGLRKGLVVFQFTVSILLIIGTITIYQQIEHAKTRPIGFQKEGLITMTARNLTFARNSELFGDELKKTGVVEEVAMSNYSLKNTLGNNGGFSLPEDPEPMPVIFNTIFVSTDYGKTTNWEVIAGRDFSNEQGDESNSIIVSQSAVEAMGLEDPIGQAIISDNSFNNHTEFTIIGVVKDMIKGSPFEESMPLMLFHTDNPRYFANLFIRIDPSVSINEALPVIENVFRRVHPDAPFIYEFVDDQYLAKFRAEEQAGTLAFLFSGMAILISCLGLFGLSAFMVTQRVKEIGIRKVLGASITNLWTLLSKDFGILILIACVIAIPVSSYLMNSWLSDYEYRIPVYWWIYATGAAFCFIITMLAISYHSIKASLANPIESIK